MATEAEKEAEKQAAEKAAEKAQADARAAQAVEDDNARKAKEDDDKKRREATNHNPHKQSADVTKDFLDKEWEPFKKRNVSLFGEPAQTTQTVASQTAPLVKRPHHEVCAFGFLCPFPNESHE